MSTALAALSRYPTSGSFEARSSSGPAATTLGACVPATVTAPCGLRRSQPRTRLALTSPGWPPASSPAVTPRLSSSPGPGFVPF